MPTPSYSRIQTAVNRKKALKQYETLRRANVVDKAIVIAELKDGSYHILGQDLTPENMAPMLVAAVEALTHAEANRKLIKLVVHQEPAGRGTWNQSKPRAKEIKTAPDGTMIPPAGENFISCGERNHPTWFVLHHDADDTPSRTACSHCGNEVKMLRITHREGTA